MDASFPHKTFGGKSDHYVCTLKIADPEQDISDDGVIETCTVVFFASKFEELPICQKIGQIIRVHRATVTEYNGVKLFTSRLYYNSSWALFNSENTKRSSKKEEVLGYVEPEAGIREYEPFRFFGKSYSAVDANQQKIIRNLRSWMPKVLSKHSALEETLKISEIKDHHDEKTKN